MPAPLRWTSNAVVSAPTRGVRFRPRDCRVRWPQSGKVTAYSPAARLLAPRWTGRAYRRRFSIRARGDDPPSAVTATAATRLSWPSRRSTGVGDRRRALGESASGGHTGTRQSRQVDIATARGDDLLRMTGPLGPTSIDVLENALDSELTPELVKGLPESRLGDLADVPRSFYRDWRPPRLRAGEIRAGIGELGPDPWGGI